MPIGLLVWVGLVALGTLSALAPLRRPRIPAAITSRLGVAVNEMPAVAGLAVVAATLLAIGQGDVSSPAEWAVVALAGLTLAGLALVAWRGLRARSAIERALVDGLGAEWRAAIDPAMAARLGRRPPLARVLLAPWVYAELPGAQHAFDLFHSLRFEAVVDGIEAFAAWVCSTR